MIRNYCTRINTTLKSIESGKDNLVFRPRCKQWHCEFCAIKNMKAWRYRIMLETETSIQNVWFFWTITLDGNDHKTNNPQADSLKKWRKIWDKLMKRIRRDMKQFSKNKFRYVRVFESHKSGVLHVHMLSDIAYNDICEFRQYNRKTRTYDIVWRSKSLEMHLKDLGIGTIHDLRPINTENSENNGVARNVSAYITKYMTKDLQGDLRNVLKHNDMSRIRMIQTSQSFGKIEKIEPDRVWVVGVLKLWEHESLPNGNKSIDLSRELELEINDFGDEEHYPNKMTDLQWIAEIMELDNNE